MNAVLQRLEIAYARDNLCVKFNQYVYMMLRYVGSVSIRCCVTLGGSRAASCSKPRLLRGEDSRSAVCLFTLTLTNVSKWSGMDVTKGRKTHEFMLIY